MATRDKVAEAGAVYYTGSGTHVMALCPTNGRIPDGWWWGLILPTLEKTRFVPSFSWWVRV